MKKQLILWFVVAVVVAGLIMLFLSMSLRSDSEKYESSECASDAMMCPDGTYVGRSGPNCEFECENLIQVRDDLLSHIEEMEEQIVVENPVPTMRITSPLNLSGQAVGNWFFEASAPVTLLSWDGSKIAESYITAEGEWMTTDFVPFSGELRFESPYQSSDPEFMKEGLIVFRKSNPSGLPENEVILEMPILFGE
jgi:hypothetical protein